MENKNLIEIISLSEKTPNVFENLKKQILELESNFNTTVNNLLQEEIAIKANSINKLKNLANSHLQQFTDEEDNFINGKWIISTVNVFTTEWENEIKKLYSFRVGLIIIGVILFFVLWYIGLFVGVGGYFIINSHIDEYKLKIDKISKLVKGKNSINEIDSKSIMAISQKLKEKLEKNSKEIKKRIEAIRISLDSDYRKIEEIEVKELEVKIEEFRKRQKITIAELKQKTSDEISNIRLTLNNHLLCELNCMF